jgi:hypothetical protein
VSILTGKGDGMCAYRLVVWIQDKQMINLTFAYACIIERFGMVMNYYLVYLG